MPPKTEKQRRWLWTNRPDIMKRWRRRYGKKGVQPTGGRKKKR